MVIRMEKEEEKSSPEEIREVRMKAANALIEYLKTFYPEDSRSNSKHALMGPVGKLLSKIMNTGQLNWGAIKGYVLNIHKNQQKGRGVSAEAAKRLEEAVEELKKLNNLLPPTKWLKTVEDLDDEVFFGAYKAKLEGQRKGIQKKFQAWLKEQYDSIDDINELMPPGQAYPSFDEIEDPFSTPSDINSVVEDFWEDYKEK